MSRNPATTHQSTLFAEDSHAKTSPPQVSDEGSPVSDRASGTTLRPSSRRSARRGSSSKTSPPVHADGCPRCGVTCTCLVTIRPRRFVVAYPHGQGLALGREQPAREELATSERGGSPDGTWPAEPGVGRMAHGVPRRVDRILALGNSVVPQCAEVIGRVIMATLTKGPAR
jgi:hypothetical protein